MAGNGASPGVPNPGVGVGALPMGGNDPTPPGGVPGAGATGEPRSAGGVMRGKSGSGAFFASVLGLSHPAIMMPPKTTAWMPTKTATMTGRFVFRLAFCSRSEPCGLNGF